MNSLPQEVLAIIIAFVYDKTTQSYMFQEPNPHLIQLDGSRPKRLLDPRTLTYLRCVRKSQEKGVYNVQSLEKQTISMSLTRSVSYMNAVLRKCPLLLFKEWYRLYMRMPGIIIELKRLNRFMKWLKVLRSILNSVLVRKVFWSGFLDLKAIQINTEWSEIEKSIKITANDRAMPRRVAIGNSIKLNGASCIVDSFRFTSEGPTMIIAHATECMFLSKLFPDSTSTVQRNRNRIYVSYQGRVKCYIEYGTIISFRNMRYTVRAININADGIPESLTLDKTFHVVLMPYGTRAQYAGDIIVCPLSEFHHDFAHVFF